MCWVSRSSCLKERVQLEFGQWKRSSISITGSSGISTKESSVSLGKSISVKAGKKKRKGLDEILRKRERIWAGRRGKSFLLFIPSNERLKVQNPLIRVCVSVAHHQPHKPNIATPFLCVARRGSPAGKEDAAHEIQGSTPSKAVHFCFFFFSFCSSFFPAFKQHQNVECREEEEAKRMVKVETRKEGKEGKEGGERSAK